MKSFTLILLFVFGILSSCKKRPTYCKSPYEVKEIKLIPINKFYAGKEVIIKNPNLIQYITSQICNIKDVSWATGTRGERKRIEMKFVPPTKKKIYVVERGLNNNDYRFREGTTYFRNDTLCELIFTLVEKNSNDTLPIIVN